MALEIDIELLYDMEEVGDLVGDFVGEMKDSEGEILGVSDGKQDSSDGPTTEF